MKQHTALHRRSVPSSNGELSVISGPKWVGCFGTREAPCSWTFHMNFRKPFVKNVLKDVCGLDLD